MRRFDWLAELLARFEDQTIQVGNGSKTTLQPAHLLHIPAPEWGRALAEVAQFACRFSALWVTETLPTAKDEYYGFFILSCCVEKRGDYVVFRTEIASDTPEIASITPFYPAANRVERHIQDLFGIRFIDHPDKRRWIRHQAWQEHEYPLRKAFSAQGAPPHLTPPDSDYPFLQAQGIGVYEIPVGPVHAGIIEPGHFRFQAVGEKILNLEEHLGYIHKGTEKIAEGRDPIALAKLAGRVSGDSTVAHTWAACMAMERAAQVTIPPRAQFLRAILCERERVANHLGDVGAICNDVAFSFAFYQFARLREEWQRLNVASFGHRFLMDCIIPCGVKTDLAANLIPEHKAQLHVFQQEVEELAGIIDRHTGIEDRLETTGILSLETASRLGCLGYVGRASGLTYDVRRACPYPPYDEIVVEVPVFKKGDVKARLQIRLAEIQATLTLLNQLLSFLPTGDIVGQWQIPLENAEGLGIIEGWRGEIVSYIRFGKAGLIDRFYPRDPSWLTWSALELMIRNDIVPDFPVCNKSVNGSYSGVDL
ncbi:NADH-quinone oxidoreductase subunit C [Beggiatoa leptomitoformis]|uniref:Ni,Fe-hydrogenase III large subunit n=1 Tax=Beggiatoa leptomitoformis TaxID=288004 RepID=A0A2N9YEI2_9GAMM|nr:NADH-quinone oxidoreductase subunit C [Beggiatoa leptomitoformis]ALG68734.1 Ni,Fe-hydrogenase III large subunit [Beggiatoa leptomitoformis]AUI68908.1 Ni,Fe-hydrogenase III large subunit [Beggiatoa leptomitoformis]